MCSNPSLLQKKSMQYVLIKNILVSNVNLCNLFNLPFCSDGITTAPLAMVTLTYPYLYEVFLKEANKSLCTHLYMPQFRAEEIFARIWQKMTSTDQVT